MTPKTKDSTRLARLGWVQCKGQPRPNQLDLDASDQNWIPLATSSSMKSLRSHFSYVLIDNNIMSKLSNEQMLSYTYYDLERG